MDSESHPPSRDGGTQPAERLLALLRDGERDRTELSHLLGLDQRRIAGLLARLADDVVVSDDGRVGLKAPPTERPPRRGRSLDHLRLRGERRAADANEQADVAAVRKRLLGDELLTRERVPAWLEEKARSGEVVEGWIVDYAGPTDIYERHVASTSELEPLRQLSERLASKYGWQPAQATVFVLTDTVPVNGVRITTRRTFPDPGVPARWTVEFDADEDAEIVAKAIRRTQRAHGIARKPKSADAERSARLAPFVAAHGTGADAHELWNREQSVEVDRYSTRQSWHRAVKRVTAA